MRDKFDPKRQTNTLAQSTCSCVCILFLPFRYFIFFLIFLFFVKVHNTLKIKCCLRLVRNFVFLLHFSPVRCRCWYCILFAFRVTWKIVYLQRENMNEIKKKTNRRARKRLKRWDIKESTKKMKTEKHSYFFFVYFFLLEA